MNERPVHNVEGTLYSYVDTELPDYTVPQHIRPQYKTYLRIRSLKDKHESTAKLFYIAARGMYRPWENLVLRKIRAYYLGTTGVK
jgi:hypothetical protein